jgi:formylglycine-generating enzyme required for sulfatase activity
MSGNVWEWTCSAYDEGYGGEETTCAPGRGIARRVIRGGAWTNKQASNVRAASRYDFPPDFRIYYVGFRLAGDTME